MSRGNQYVRILPVAISRRELLISTGILTAGLAVAGKLNVEIGKSRENASHKRWRRLISSIENANDPIKLDSDFRQLITVLYNPDTSLPPPILSLHLDFNDLYLTKTSDKLEVQSNMLISNSAPKTLEEALQIYDNTKQKNIYLNITYQTEAPYLFIATLPAKSRELIRQIYIPPIAQCQRGKASDFSFNLTDSQISIASIEYTAIFSHLPSAWASIMTVKKIKNGTTTEFYGEIYNYGGYNYPPSEKVDSNVAEPIHNRITLLTEITR